MVLLYELLHDCTHSCKKERLVSRISHIDKPTYGRRKYTVYALWYNSYVNGIKQLKARKFEKYFERMRQRKEFSIHKSIQIT